MNTRLLVLAALTLVIACEGSKTPTGPGAPNDPSSLISDGAHGGNKDFFFLPPLVSDPSKDPNFEAGQFNPTLAATLTVEICRLQASPVDAAGQPVVTDCVTGPPVKKFPAGTITLQNPPDGFYQVVWHVAESNLDATKFYRIKVLVEGSPTPFGVADVDPVVSMKELRNARTGEVIPLNENSTLPIKFRIEHGGGPTLCGDSNLCTSVTVTNNSSTGNQSVTLEGGAGSIAGARFPNGWLPAGGPQSVVVTIAQITTTGGGSTTDPSACHTGLALPQYRGCFSFTTTPHLNPINEGGDQFAQPVTVAVCYELDGTGSPLEKFAELWASGPGEPPHPLDDAPDGGLLGGGSRNCNTTPPIITSNYSNPLAQFASMSWQRVKRGFSQVFGVKTAYGVDLGLGGIATAFSRISPVLTTRLVTVSPAVLSAVGPGVTITDTVRLIGSNHHANHTLDLGLGGLPVTFTLAPGNGSLLPVGGEGAGSNAVTVNTNTLPTGGAFSGGGLAPVNWTLPATPGTYTLSASGSALSGPVTFTATVIGLTDIQGTWQNENTATPGITFINISVDGPAVSVQAFGNCIPTDCDWGYTTGDASSFATTQQIGAFWDQVFATRTMTIKALSSTRLQMTLFTDFTPADGRTDYTLVEYFQRPPPPPPIP